MQPTRAHASRAVEDRRPPSTAGSRAVTAAAALLLLVCGGLLGLVGAFLVPTRVLGVPGIAVLVAVVGNLGVGLLAGRGLGSRAAAALPAAGWLVVVLLAGIGRPEGDLVIPGRLPGDPAVATVGTLFLLVGIAAAAVPIGLDPHRPLHRWR